LTSFGGIFIEQNFNEIICPSIAEQSVFADKVGPENERMMWNFQDKGGRDVCLIPEVTGLLQAKYRANKKSENIFYVQRCYRYERPQAGRYREFTQFGVETMGSTNILAAFNLMKKCFDRVGVSPTYDSAAKRGLSYYDGDGFEARIEKLGAQKQVAGGGAYAEGVGFAIGIDRLLLAMS
jgi:histidyl-tRNA synthetase